jgi:hypothetical protein
MCDILKDEEGPSLPVSITMEMLLKELKVIENVMVYWSLTTGVSEERKLAGLDKEFRSADRNSTNMRFCMYVYCMVNTIWEKYGILEKLLAGREPKDLMRGAKRFKEYQYNEYQYDETELDNFMRKVIRECCSGDFDDFIISVKDRYANSVIGKYHMMLAKIKGYELLGIDTFDDIPETEAWRRLFTTYFDKEEDNFPLFYQTYTRQCYEFVLLSFLSVDGCGGINYIPVFKVYSDDNFKESYETSIKGMINTKMIRLKLNKLYKKSIK